MILAAAIVTALTVAAAPPRPAPGRAVPAAADAEAAKPLPPGQRPKPSVEAMFLYDLAAPDGIVKITWPTIEYDRAHAELFVVSEGFVRVFDASGMEVHRFGDDGSLGHVIRVAALEDGELIVLTTRSGKRAYLRCNFRGELISEMELTGIPDAFKDFEPDQLVYHDARLYFAERRTMRVVITDVTGDYRQSFRVGDLVARALTGDGERRPPQNFDAFNVDRSGNMLFTISTMFGAAVLSPGGELRIFGIRGSTPGKFNVIGGIDSDEGGTLYVTDRLRSVVSIWSRDLRFLGEFGYRGPDVWNLLTPFEIAVGNGRVFVTQAGKRGVKVFRVDVKDPELEPLPPKPGQPEPEREPEPVRRPPPSAVG